MSFVPLMMARPSGKIVISYGGHGEAQRKLVGPHLAHRGEFAAQLFEIERARCVRGSAPHCGRRG